MIKGVNYTGVCVVFLCHDGAGNYLFQKRSNKCRDNHRKWDCGGGGLKFQEGIEHALLRELKEEYGVAPVHSKQLGVREAHGLQDGRPTHWIAFDYLVEVDRAKVVNGEPEMISELSWLRLDDLPPDDELHQQLPELLAKYNLRPVSVS